MCVPVFINIYLEVYANMGLTRDLMDIPSGHGSGTALMTQLKDSRQDQL